MLDKQFYYKTHLKVQYAQLNYQDLLYSHILNIAAITNLQPHNANQCQNGCFDIETMYIACWAYSVIAIPYKYNVGQNNTLSMYHYLIETLNNK